MTPNSILRLPAVLKGVGISKSMVYRLMVDGRFPKPIKLGPRAVGWRAKDIKDWLDRREHADIG